MGTTFATHYLIALDGSGDKELPIFRTKEHATRYIADWPNTGLVLSQVDDANDLVILLELFKKRGGNYVRLDPQVSRAGEILGGDIAPEINQFIRFVRP